MIHELVITAGMELRAFSKLARRYAMTGGFELSLADELQPEELERLVDTFLPDARSRVSGSPSRLRASGSFRVLELLFEHPLTPQDARARAWEEVLRFGEISSERVRATREAN